MSAAELPLPPLVSGRTPVHERAGEPLPPLPPFVAHPGGDAAAPPPHANLAWEEEPEPQAQSAAPMAMELAADAAAGVAAVLEELAQRLRTGGEAALDAAEQGDRLRATVAAALRGFLRPEP